MSTKQAVLPGGGLFGVKLTNARSFDVPADAVSKSA
jgi:hypothetical protein